MASLAETSDWSSASLYQRANRTTLKSSAGGWPATPPTFRYNSSSGQVFSETTVPAKRSEKLSLDTDRRRSFSFGCNGAPTLESMAMREIMRNITSLTPEIWADIPWQLGKRIWAEVERKELVRVSVWKGFIGAYHQDAYRDEIHSSYIRCSENVPTVSLLDRIQYLSSPEPFHFVTCLTISKVQFSRADILNISLLRNLGALDIAVGSGEGSEVDDSILRNWGRRASEEGDAFPMLRVLLLRNQIGVTAQSFQHLNELPSMVLFGVQGCCVTTADEPVAKLSGWTCEDSQGLLQGLDRDIALAHTWDSPIRLCYERSGSVCNTAGDQQQPTLPLPILNFRIGPTSKEVIFSLSSSLVFFRRLEMPPKATSIAAGTTPGKDHGPKPKKRKLRGSIHVDLDGLLKAL